MGWSFGRTKCPRLFPSTGLCYQPSLLDTRQLLPYRISPLGILSVVIVAGLIIYGMSSSAPANASAPVIPVMQTVAAVAAPVTATHFMKQHKGKHAIQRRAQVTSLEPDDMIVQEPENAVLD
jgi:hypothetical protein